ncbi:MAG: M48 family metalloprotease [Alphaproteobacteria bacterium]|nr:M48 family metalloprotease [Alphaproteobacteria bacterium]
MPALRAIFAALFIPALGAALTLYIIQSAAAAEGASLSDIAHLCLPGGPSLSLSPVCANIQNHYTLLLVCAATAVAGLALILAFSLASFFTGANRVLLSFIFPGLSFLGLVVVALLVVAQIAIIAATAYFAEAFWLGQVHVTILLGFAAIGTLLGLGILWRTLRMFRPAVGAVIGVPFSPIEQPRLALLVQQIAKATNARMPDNIVLGLDPNFFATTAPMHTPTSRRLLTGQTLYLSLPLMRVLSLDEVKAVVGHELAHFSGADTIYSRHFAPIYRGLEEAAQAAGEHKKYDKNPLLMPARLFLRFMIDCFARNAAKSSRSRELRADQIGSTASSPADLGYALIKVGILSMLWNKEIEDTLHDISRGKFRRNMSASFEDKLQYDVDPEKLPPLVAFSLGDHTPHPTDSHPETKERLTELGLNLVDVTSEARVMERFFAAKPAALALDSMENVEEILTQIYHQIIIGPRNVPQTERTTDEVFVSFLSAFLAHMVTADGVVDEREVETAEREAISHIGNGFDPREFREFCRNTDQLAPLSKLVEWSTKFLTPSGFEMLLDMLTKIAQADGDLHEREQKILNDVRAVYEELKAAQAAGATAGPPNSPPR